MMVRKRRRDGGVVGVVVDYDVVDGL